jgi:hypothetical protein
MTLPGFEYPHQMQPGCWQERACTRALESTFPQWGAAMGEWGADLEHDDLMDAEDYDRRRAERDGWATATWDGR